MTEASKKTIKNGNEFSVVPRDRRAEEARRKKLLKIGLTLGAMVLVLIITVVGLICYSAGVAKQDKSEATNTSSSESDESSASLAPESASKFMSAADVGENQIPDHYRGSDNPKVTVIEYADYGCSHCQELAKSMGDVYEKYGDKVRFILRYYNVGFANSEVMAKLANAVYLVGGEDAFWKASDKLFEDTGFSNSFTSVELDNKIRSYGTDLGLDGQAVLDAYNNNANNGIANKIERDISYGNDSGVSGTPSIFINRELLNSASASDLTAKLDELLK